MSRYLAEHIFKPVFDSNSRVLILGTMPSPKSRENGFYYTHPQNRFWRVISELFGEKTPTDNAERIKLLISHNIALWDVLQSCTIDGASDSSIKNPTVNDISILISKTNIKAIFTTGKKAYSLYNKYCLEKTKIPAIPLLSTSPANCRFSYGEILKDYSVLLDYVG